MLSCEAVCRFRPFHQCYMTGHGLNNARQSHPILKRILLKHLYVLNFRSTAFILLLLKTNYIWSKVAHFLMHFYIDEKYTKKKILNLVWCNIQRIWNLKMLKSFWKFNKWQIRMENFCRIWHQFDVWDVPFPKPKGKKTVWGPDRRD